jgi:hypothetical protein
MILFCLTGINTFCCPMPIHVAVVLLLSDSYILYNPKNETIVYRSIMLEIIWYYASCIAQPIMKFIIIIATVIAKHTSESRRGTLFKT